jgi:hypothetical protein
MIPTEFWRRMKTFRPSADRISGHNNYDFDLKFILKRSIIHGVQPTVDLSFARYRNQPIFDTMHEWECWSYGSKVKLETLAGAFGFRSSKENGRRLEYLWSLQRGRASSHPRLLHEGRRTDAGDLQMNGF